MLHLACFRTARILICTASCFLSLAGTVPLRAQEESGLGAATRDPAASELFEKAIRPALIENCLDCHASDTEASGGLLLDSRDGWEAGGDSGAAILAGEPAASLLYRAISYEDPDLQMPPDGKLPDSVLEKFRDWIEQGAVDPRRGVAALATQTGLPVDQAQEHWAYRQPAKPTVAGGQMAATDAASPIDVMIDAKLASEGLTAAGRAGKAELLRRLCFDLHGLPPTPQQLDRFLNDSSTNAYERVVDTLLASPRFGEVLARHWMDVARYADSITLRGFILPEAWRYRDYLIDSFNQDRPFDTMIREQIAGDLMNGSDLERRQMQLKATGFLVLGNTNLERQDKAQLEMDFIDEQLEVIGRAFLGQTIGCARCHDHKFDPIPTADYYAMAGILRSTAALKHSNVSKWVERPLPLPPEQEARLTEIAQDMDAIDQQIKSIKKKIAALESENPKRYSVADLPGVVVDSSLARLVGSWTPSTHVKPYIGEGYLHAPASRGAQDDEQSEKRVHTATFEPTALPPGKYEVRLAYTPSSNRASNANVHVFSADGEAVHVVNQRKVPPDDALWVSLGQYRFEKDGQAYVLVSNKNADGVVIVDAVQFVPLSNVSTASAVTEDESQANEALTGLKKRLQPLESNRKKLERKLAERPQYLTLVEQGEPTDIPIHVRGDVHNLGEVVPRGFLTAIPPRRLIAKDSSGRIEMAEWLSSHQNPLTARVYANRVWLWMMGQGIVPTPNNFGTTGAPPSHTELLDWLAHELVSHDWSTKHLVKQIVCSEAYQRSLCSPNADQLARDPENRLYWRGHSRRLTAESLRDGMLMVSGELDLTMGGSLIRSGSNSDYEYQHQTTRRSIYHPVFRNSLPDLFEAFDFADTSVSIAKRPRSTVATQALVLMNHPWVLARASAASQRLSEEFELDANWDRRSLSEMLSRIYRRCFARAPSADEQSLGLDYLLESKDPEDRRKRLEHYVHSLLASLDFRYLD